MSTEALLANEERKQVWYWKRYRAGKKYPKRRRLPSVEDAPEIRRRPGEPYDSVQNSDFPRAAAAIEKYKILRDVKEALKDADDDEVQLQDDPAIELSFWDCWRPLKILGAGSFGLVQAWQYIGNQSRNAPPMDEEHRAQIGKMMVIKNAQDERFPLDDEAEFMETLQKTNATHLVQLARTPKKLDWDELRFIYMEYCAGGDFNREIIDRWANPAGLMYPSEKNLWKTFHCLAKACMALYCGSEDGTAPIDGWDRFIHFDLKPKNVMIGSKDNLEHRDRRPYKIGDFGNSSQLEFKGRPMYAKEDFRTRGTEGWYVPEQFTRRWDYIDMEKGPNDDEICGNYDSRSNVWAVGAMIWCYALLADTIMPVLDGYKSSLDPALAQGTTYGKAIETSPHSMNFRILVLRCLMENPKHRPSPEELYIATLNGQDDASYLDDDEDDSWDYEHDMESDVPFVPGLFKEPTATQGVAFPNFSNGKGGPGVALQPSGAGNPPLGPAVEGARGNKRRETRSTEVRRRVRRNRDLMQDPLDQSGDFFGDLFEEEDLPEDLLDQSGDFFGDLFEEEDLPERSYGAWDQEDIDIPRFTFAHAAFPEEVPRSRHGMSSIWRAAFDPEVPDRPEPEVFRWTLDLIRQYAQRYANRARLCGYGPGIQAAIDYPEDMARLQLDWVNSRILAREQGVVAEWNLRIEKGQMELERARAEREKADRLNAAADDATRVVGFTPADLQAIGAEIRANVRRTSDRSRNT